MYETSLEASVSERKVLNVFEPSPEVVDFVDSIIYGIEVEARTIGVKTYMRRLNDSICYDSETAVKFALFADKTEVNSDTEAILVPGPFGTKLETMVVIGEMIRQIGKGMDMRDESGRSIPVVMYSAPVGDAGVKLDRAQKLQIEAGDFTPIGKKYLQTTRKFMPDLQKVSIMGVSFGGSMVPVLANVAAQSNVSVERLIVGVPGNMAKERSVGNLAISFASEGAAMAPYLRRRQGVFARPPVAGFGAIARQASTNLTLIQGLAVGNFFNSYLQFTSRQPDVPAYMFFTDGDQVAPTKAAEEYLHLFDGLKSSRLSTPERHGVVYDQHVLGTAIATALLGERS